MRQAKWRLPIWIIALMAAVASSAIPSCAESWPQRPVRIVVPVGAGSSPDVAARIFAERLKARWGRPVVVENRPGADGLIGTAEFAAAHDDHTLLFSFAAPLTVYPAVKDNLAYDAVRDIVPISMVAETFGTITVSASLPVTTLSELAAFARSRPGQLNWTSGGGAFPILFAGFLRSAGLDMIEVPYRDQNLALQDVTQNRIQIIVTPMTAVLPLVQAGKLRALAVTNSKRSPLWPAVPTATDAGFPDLAFEGLFGLFGPRGIPDERRQRLSEDIRIIAADRAIVERLAATGQVVRGSTPAEFAAAIDEQRAKIMSIVRFAAKPKG
jgi:tripartite-type tricarboxylate transporter receptor subunit TctC